MTKREMTKEAVGGVCVLAIIAMLLGSALLFDDGVPIATIGPLVMQGAGR